MTKRNIKCIHYDLGFIKLMLQTFKTSHEQYSCLNKIQDTYSTAIWWKKIYSSVAYQIKSESS